MTYEVLDGMFEYSRVYSEIDGAIADSYVTKFPAYHGAQALKKELLTKGKPFEGP